MSTTMSTSNSTTRRPLKLLGGMLATALVSSTIGAGAAEAFSPPLGTGPEPVPVTGEAWPEIEDDVNQFMTDFVNDLNLPGASIAASYDGRLVVSSGYGYANTDTEELMTSDHQVLLGSVTKALISGQAVGAAMAEAGLSLDTKLYGAGGVYGTMFDADIAEGAAATGTPLDWYYDISVQHILDHRAGFGGASANGTKQYFDITDDELTYELVHRHFLRTKGLLYEPGNGYQYSNHGIGSMKLLVEELTGEDHVDYVVDEVLAPLGLQHEIEPRHLPYRPLTADVHKYEDGEPVPYDPDFEEPLGNFAGAYRGSVQDMVELMVGLAEDHTPAELDDLAFWDAGVTTNQQWGDDSTAYLSHNGVIGGGRTYVFMTVDGINVAINTPIANSEAIDNMLGLFHDVADLIRDTEIPEHYDIWADCTLPAISSGYAQVARHGVPIDDYQCLFDQLTGAGYKLDWLDVSETPNGDNIVNTLFVPADGSSWRAFHGLTGSQYQKLFDEQVRIGRAPAQVDSYPTTRGVRYAGWFEPADGPFVAYHGLTKTAHQDRFDELAEDGFRPTSLSVVATGQGLRYTGVYEKDLPGSFLVKSRLTPAKYQDLFDAQVEKGRAPVYLNGYRDSNDQARIVAIFASQPKDPFIAKHGMTSASYQAAWNDATQDGYATDVVTAYPQGSRVRYAAVWR